MNTFARIAGAGIILAAAVAVMAGCVATDGAQTCTPPSDQANMIEQFRADALLAVVPTGGRLVNEWAMSHACDNVVVHGDREASRLVGFAAVGKLYQTPVVYNADQLQQLFAESLSSAGWRQEDPPESTGSWSRLVYCKQSGTRATYAVLWSSDSMSTPEQAAMTGVMVDLDAGREGTSCGRKGRGTPSPSPR